ncbi:hypothetical protein T4D_3656 [Trichinella pseudospiralis]|uniref:Uncharacterized protein n=1 Tax=Trichinella pseudospiralis TaxID=6337 RepID=A0A0V1F5T1_TRIPS|nr:hypothetical protein T4D_3656 [Trichinella pseudospiralis]
MNGDKPTEHRQPELCEPIGHSHLFHGMAISDEGNNRDEEKELGMGKRNSPGIKSTA